jgi:DNA invertase Pin-like site-specific DNA recombinase
VVTAYSYIRFSSPKQAEGDSLRRQTQDAQDYCDEKGWSLDTTLTLRDLGVSAWKGKNADVGNLRTFLDAIQTKRVVPGDVLIVEALDRITRQGIDEGYDLIKRILKAGVRIVTLSPEREFDRDSVRDIAKNVEIMLILDQAAKESELKSKRVGAVKAQQRQKAREKGALFTKRLPAWVRLVDGRLVLDEVRAEVIRRVYRLSVEGYGSLAIAMKLDEEGVPPISGSERWNQSYIHHLLNTRAVLGEWQPMKGRQGERKTDGPPIKDYFPAVIEDEDLWHAAKAAAALRKGRPSRSGKKNCVRIFSGLLRDAGDGRLIRVANKGSRKGGGARLVPRSGKYVTFPLAAFEEAILSQLREVDPRELLPRPDGGPAARVLSLSGQLAEKEAELAKVKDRLERKYSDAVADVLERHEEAVASLRLELAQVRQEAASPTAEAWGELRSLLDVPGTDDARVRLRAALRRVVESISCVFAALGRERLAVAFVALKEGVTRRFAIHYVPGGKSPTVVSLRDDEVGSPGVKDALINGVLGTFFLKAEEAAWSSVLEPLQPTFEKIRANLNR